MKHKSTYIFICIFTLAINIILLILGIKFTKEYEYLFNILFCFISCVSTTILATITIWQTNQFKQIEDKRNYLPNLLIFCSNSKEKTPTNIFKTTNKTKNISNLNVFINSPNGTIYRLILKKAFVYNNGTLVENFENKQKTISHYPHDCDILFKEHELYVATIFIDKKYFENDNFYIDLEFEYFNVEGHIISKTIRMEYLKDYYNFLTIKPAHYIKNNKES